MSKNYTESRYVRKNLDIDMNDHKITNLEAPTTNTDAATKKYVDDKKCKFKDGTTTTSDVDLRTSASGSEFCDDVTFKANAKCKDLNVLSSSDAIVNRNSLETGRLVGIQSLSSTVSGLVKFCETRNFDHEGKSHEQHDHHQAPFFERKPYADGGQR